MQVMKKVLPDIKYTNMDVQRSVKLEAMHVALWSGQATETHLNLLYRRRPRCTSLATLNASSTTRR